MAYGGKELAASFRTVRSNTITIAEEIPEAKYDFRAAPDTRSIGQTLTHIGLLTSIPLHMHSNKVDDLAQVNFPELMQKAGAEEAKARTKAEVITLLRSEGDKFAAFLESQPDAVLAETVRMLPGAEP